MNKYVVPVCNLNSGDLFIEKINASNMESAIIKLSESYDLDYCDNYEDLVDEMLELGYNIGEILDIEEL